jgi:hypothetical protein
VSAVPAVAAVAALEDRDAAGRGVRIEFLRLQDRYAHRILAVGCEELPVLLLESVEGAAEDLWPPSPAFQALNLEDLQDWEESTEAPPAAMLVGMSGSTHWSMSVKSLTASDSHGRTNREPGFYFDAAARLKSVPKVLSTRYLVGKRVMAQQSGDRTLLHFGSGRCDLHSTTPEGTRSQNVWHFDNRQNELRHDIPQDKSPLQLPTTSRWNYSIRLLAN